MIAGVLIFAQWPSAATLIGASIVIGSTVYITLREEKLKASKPNPDG
jgi:drug/metabolite transporter (DMT)-like permease